MDNTGGDRLRLYDQRITRLEEEIADLQADKSEVYKEAKDHGFDLKAFRAARRDLKIEAKRDNTEADVYGLYRDALRPNYPNQHTPDDEDDPADGQALLAPEPVSGTEIATRAGARARAREDQGVSRDSAENCAERPDSELKQAAQ